MRFAAKQITESLVVDAPDRFLGADVIEIRVQLTPLRYWDPPSSEMRECGDKMYSEVRIVRVEARDSRMIFHMVRDLIRRLAAVYLQIEI